MPYLQFMTVITLILMLVIVPAGIGYFLYAEYLGDGLSLLTPDFWHGLLHRFLRGELEPGDFLIYRKPKVSSRLGPRAQHIHAAENGDDYHYEVDKFWTVSDVLNDGRLVAVTRTGKRVYLTPKDERLRKAGLMARILHRRRFPSLF